MAKGCIGSILLIIGVSAMFGITYALGFTPLSIILGIMAGIGICFLDWWIVIGYNRYAKQKVKKIQQDTVEMITTKTKELREADVLGDFSVPIDFTNLRKVIPPGRDITHSLLMRAKIPNPPSGFRKYLTHVLITAEGFAWENQYLNDNKMIYSYWPYTRSLVSNHIAVNRAITLEHVKLNKNETKDEFNRRKYDFFFSVVDNSIEFAQKKLEAIPESTQDRELKRERRKLKSYIGREKSIRKRNLKKAKKKGYI